MDFDHLTVTFSDQGIDGFNLLRPFASGVAQRQALGGLAILAHHLADAFEFAG